MGADVGGYYVATRLSLDCCRQMAGRDSRACPVAALVSLLGRCNRSEPHKEVVSTTLDILLNLLHFFHLPARPKWLCPPLPFSS